MGGLSNRENAEEMGDAMAGVPATGFGATTKSPVRTGDATNGIVANWHTTQSWESCDRPPGCFCECSG